MLWRYKIYNIGPFYLKCWQNKLHWHLKTQSLIQKFTFLIPSDLFLLKTSCQSVKLPLSICHPERLWSHVPLSCTFWNSFVFVKNLPRYCESYVGMYEYQVCRICISVMRRSMDVVKPFYHLVVLFMFCWGVVEFCHSYLYYKP